MSPVRLRSSPAVLEGRRAAARLSALHQAPETPWTHEYAAAHRALVSALVEDASVIELIRAGEELPDGFAIGFDERVVEYPWLRSHAPGGRTLDAGSTLNHAHVLDRFLPELTSLCITTLTPEAEAFTDRGVSYVYADLRELPFRGAWFETVVCVSTLEHVGMDNTRYGAPESRVKDPDEALHAAAAELRRVTRRGGRILVTVPFGRREDHGWFRQFDAEDVERLIEAFGPAGVEQTQFAYGPRGWQRASPTDAADARYRDFTADQTPAADRAAAARAVVCLALRM